MIVCYLLSIIPLCSSLSISSRRSAIMHVSSLFVASLVFAGANAHSYIWVRPSHSGSIFSCSYLQLQGVFVNGVDQGLYKGIRTPAYNGAPGAGGYANSPVKDLDCIDIRCNVMGDIQAPDTIKVKPGDNLTLDWHHDYRNGTDDVIASSHHGELNGSRHEVVRGDGY